MQVSNWFMRQFSLGFASGLRLSSVLIAAYMDINAISVIGRVEVFKWTIDS